MKEEIIEMAQGEGAVDSIKGAEKINVITQEDCKQLGFENETTLGLLNNIPGISRQKIEDRLVFLKSKGFKYIDRIAEDYPYQLFGSREKDIENTIDILENVVGLDDPIRAISKQPQLLFVNEEKIKSRLSFLKELGFEDPSKMIKMNPGILGYTSDALVSKIGFLKDLGIDDPFKLVEVASDLLGMSKELIQDRLEFLKKTFPELDVFELIIKFKKILTYPEDEIVRRKTLLDKIFDLYDVTLKTDELVSYFPQILSYSSDRIIVIARIIKEYDFNPNDLKKTIVKLISKNLENVVFAYTESQKNGDSNIEDLMKRVNSAMKSELSEDEKHEIIEEDLHDDKISLKFNSLTS